MEFTPSEVQYYYASRLPGLRQSDTQEWRGTCPVHSGKGLNFAVSAETGFAFCHSECGKGWDLLGLEMQLTGKTFAAAKKDVFALLGRPDIEWAERDVVAIYDYTGPDGNLLYQVLRCYGKIFKQRQPDSAGRWRWNLQGITRVPFRLPKVIAAQDVFVVEGEKDVLTMERLGFVATCNSGGAKNFDPQLAQWFVGKRVFILPDNDEKGREHALKIAPILHETAASVQIAELPGLQEKGDVTDFVAAGGTADQIRQICTNAPRWDKGFQFASTLAVAEDRYVRTFAETVNECGGLDAFWDFRRRQGIPTPFKGLTDALGGGLRPSEVYVLGGNQGSGKTSMALQFVLSAIHARKGVLMFSMEMDHAAVFQRICGILAGLDLEEFRRAQKDHRPDYPLMVTQLQEAGAMLDGMPLLVSTKPSVSPDFIVSESVRLAARQQVDLVVIDHMQLMSATGSVRGDYEKFTAISRATKQTAMELKRPVLIVSQSSRTNATDKRTELEVHDLRGSGAIEEDACGIMLVYPDREHMAQCIANNTFSKGPVKSWCKLAKNRYGLSGKYLPLAHKKTITTFTEWGDSPE